MQEYFRLREQFKISPTLCNFLQLLSCDTWNRIEFVRTRMGLKVFETTLTQNILYTFRLYAEAFPTLAIKIFEATDEKTNGNDIELIIQTNQGYVPVPLQAKILYRSNHYNSMEHGNQINNLISYASSLGGIPLYLLYNYYPNVSFHYNGNICGIQHAKEQLGCSLVSAQYLLDNFAGKKRRRNGSFKWKIPGFIDLHPTIALPWFVLGCCRTLKTDKNKLTELLYNTSKTGITSISPISTYNLEELVGGDSWQPIETIMSSQPMQQVDLFENMETFNAGNAKSFFIDDKYLPKYRVVISFDQTN